MVVMTAETGKTILLDTEKHSIILACLDSSELTDMRVRCYPLATGAGQGHSNALHCSQRRPVSEMHTHW